MSVVEAIELKMPSVSPTMQSDLSTDGDLNVNLPAAVSMDKPMPSTMDAMTSEPKAKKRRKQSNPLKIQNPTSPKYDMPSYDLADQDVNDSALVLQEAPSETEYISENLVLEKSKTPDYLSQKGSLSRVTNALYNNKLREAAKSSTNSSKSKDSSLQSLTDISSPESTEEHTSVVEYKNSVQNVYSQLSMFPVNPVDVARDSLKLNMYGFTDYSSPTFPQGNANLSISQRSFVTSSGVRVFNPEAYCELCEKEFCNKYFLKTHKANKHGICSVDNNNTGGYNYKVSFKNMPMNPQTLQPNVINQMCETGASFGSADSYCNICQKYFCNKYFLKKHRQNIHGIQEEAYNPSSIHVPVISSPLPLVRGYEVNNSSGQSTKEEESKFNNVNMENFKNSLNSALPLLNGSSPQASLLSKKQMQSINLKDKKNEKFLCELCNIEFCEKCYLDAHRANKHGQTLTAGSEVIEKADIDMSNRSEDAEEPKDSFKDQMCAPCMKNFTSAESFQCHMLETHGASIKEEEDAPRTPDILNKKNGQIKLENEGNAADKSPSSVEMESSNSSTDSGYFNCTFCSMKYSDRRSFLVHLESEHNIIGSSSYESDSTVCDICQEQCQDRATLITHRVKVHGIVPPFSLEGLPESLENGDYSAVYPNVKQRGSASSFCQICNKELCNKYFMKTHMMKMHGIDVDKVHQDRWPTSPSGGVYCDICQKFLCSKYFLKIHKQNVHGIIDDSTKLSMLGSPPFNNNVSVSEKKMEWQTSDLAASMKVNNLPTDLVTNADEARGNGIFFCEICGQEFDDKVFLQIHLVEKHVKPSYTNDFSLSMDGSKSTLKSGVLPCSCCSFVNVGDSSSASLTNSLELKTISCIVCNVTYRQNDYHTHHLSHGVSLPAGSKASLENGVHDLSENVLLSSSDDKQPRKFKRFRCSKCDKTFRTKSRCVNHIQVMHKSKRGGEQQSPSKKSSPGNPKVNSHENGIGLLGGKEDKESALSSDFQDAAHIPMSYQLPKNSDVIMQPFHLSEPAPEGVSQPNLFVPSVVYLPVSKKVSETVTVAFTLTPA